jgi:hypothetical protein
MSDSVSPTTKPKTTPEYNSWKSMMNRCFWEKHENYPNYGGRGITVCERWLIFKNFRADMGLRPEGCTLDRKDNNGNYEPSNCKWSTLIEQHSNTRRNVILTVRGITGTMAHLARHFGITRFQANHRLKLGWSPEDTFLTPIRPKKPNSV